jgi:hypothetical protein
MTRSLDFIGRAELFANCSPARFGNNPVHKVSLSVTKKALCSSQFIERAESDGGNRKKVVVRLKDNPR